MRQKTQNHFFKFSIHLSVRKSQEKYYRQINGKSKASIWRNLSTGTPQKFFQYNPLFCSFSLQVIFFSRTAVLRKLFSIRFSYKHCNFSHVCLLVKMASKTVTRSIFKALFYSPLLILELYDNNHSFHLPIIIIGR